MNKKFNNYAGQPLSLELQDLLEDKLLRLNVDLSEYSFANLYLFRDIHQFEMIKLENEIFITGITRDRIPFIMLTSPPDEIPEHIFFQIISTDKMLYPIPDEWLDSIENKIAKRVIKKDFNEADSDYLYPTATFLTFPGRRLEGKRNLIKQLFKQAHVRIEPLFEQFEDARKILADWENERNEKKENTDFISCQEALLNFHLLRLSGQIIYVNHKPAGFIIGEQLSKKTYAVHFSKAQLIPHGIYQLLFQNLARSLEKECLYLNLEPDLGIPGLRKSKLSYHPLCLIKKWRLQAI